MNKKEWYAAHKSCPKCGETKLAVTSSAIAELSGQDFVDETNKATCPKCSWKGMVKQLKPDPNAKREVQNLNVVIRTMDKDNEVYVSAEDCVRAVRNFGAELLPLLHEETRPFTENILTEILKIFVSADVNHRKAKYEEQERLKLEATSENETLTNG